MRPLFQRLGCCIERRTASASSQQRQDSYEMTKLPSAARALVQTLEDVNMRYPITERQRTASVDANMFWLDQVRKESLVSSHRHTSNPSGPSRASRASRGNQGLP